MKKIRRSRRDLLFDIMNYSLIAILLVLVLYPLYFVLIASVSNPVAVNSGEVWLLPKRASLEGYMRIFKDHSIVRGYSNSIMYTILGTFINLVFTIPAAYALSRKDLKGRTLFMYLITFTMFFSGGLIPSFLLIKNLGMYNTIWSILLPSAVIPWNLIIARTFFQSTIPDELHEAAQLDGCNDFTFFCKIALPLSTTLISVMVLFYGVVHWNSFFNAMIYLNNKSLYPLQLVLRNILIINQASAEMMDNVELANKQQEIVGLIQYGVIVVSALPLLVLYPFLQKYFVKGVMIGSVKG